MNINIKPLKKKNATDGIHAVGFEMYDPKAVEKLEADFKEAIEALKEMCIDAELLDQGSRFKGIEIIEKVTDQKWEDIKNPKYIYDPVEDYNDSTEAV